MFGDGLIAQFQFDPGQFDQSLDAQEIAVIVVIDGAQVPRFHGQRQIARNGQIGFVAAIAAATVQSAGTWQRRRVRIVADRVVPEGENGSSLTTTSRHVHLHVLERIRIQDNGQVDAFVGRIVKVNGFQMIFILQEDELQVAEVEA